MSPVVENLYHTLPGDPERLYAVLLTLESKIMATFADLETKISALVTDVAAVKAHIAILTSTSVDPASLATAETALDQLHVALTALVAPAKK